MICDIQGEQNVFFLITSIYYKKTTNIYFLNVTQLKKFFFSRN